MSVGNSLRVPHFLTAGSRDALQREMLNNNLKNGREYTYFDISFDGSKWTAWFYRVAEIREVLKPAKGKVK